MIEAENPELPAYTLEDVMRSLAFARIGVDLGKEKFAMAATAVRSLIRELAYENSPRGDLEFAYSLLVLCSKGHIPKRSDCAVAVDLLAQRLAWRWQRVFGQAEEDFGSRN
ncbi:MAG: hypothetical protein KGL39_53830 [Patescibacteria group bacterium]|nr:hypothetical protein [Patescibacteria group bacterium]